MQFTKLFSLILDSTIWQEPLETKVVWITLLAMKDRHGEVHASVPGLAKRAGVSLQQCEASLACLLAPDPYSRTKTDEGRRIRPIEGGWKLVNNDKYQNLLSAEERKEYNRRKQAEHREKLRASNAVNDTSNDVSKNKQCQHIIDAEVDLYAEVEVEKEANQNSISKNNNDDGKKVSFSMPSLEEFTAYYGKAMEDVDLGEHLMLSDWLLEQHSHCTDRWETKPPVNWKSQVGRFTKFYRDYWNFTKPVEKPDDEGEDDNGGF